MEGRRRARPARRLAVSVVPVASGVTLVVPSMLVSTLTVLGRIVSRMGGWCRKVFERNRDTANGTLGAANVTPGATGATFTPRRRAGCAPLLPSIYGQSDTLCKSEHFRAPCEPFTGGKSGKSGKTSVT